MRDDDPIIRWGLRLAVALFVFAMFCYAMAILMAATA